MSIIIFIIVLLVLVMIHESGHFFAAKLSKMRVEEFAFGFPPRIFGKKYGETFYAFNAIPLGGYVSIWGENGSDEEIIFCRSLKPSTMTEPLVKLIFKTLPASKFSDHGVSVVIIIFNLSY